MNPTKFVMKIKTTGISLDAVYFRKEVIMKCNKCGFEGSPNLEETGCHTKATCPECNAYIKMVGKDELNKIIVVDDDELTLVIKTKAGREYMPDILKEVTLALKRGYITGEGVVIKPFDDEGYPYEFYYSKV